MLEDINPRFIFDDQDQPTGVSDESALIHNTDILPKGGQRKGFVILQANPPDGFAPKDLPTISLSFADIWDNRSSLQFPHVRFKQP